MEENKLYVTARELATMLSCSEGLIHKLKSEGKLPYMKMGKSLRFELAEVIKILKENTIDKSV